MRLINLVLLTAAMGLGLPLAAQEPATQPTAPKPTQGAKDASDKPEKSRAGWAIGGKAKTGKPDEKRPEATRNRAGWALGG